MGYGFWRSRLAVLAIGMSAAALAPGIQSVGAQVDETNLEALEFRSLGPYRGGRSTTVAGVNGDNLTYYMGATGGGVWKTTNGGTSWTNISDDKINVGTIGAIDVADSDANIIFVGTGAAPVRGVASASGNGIYKSTDAGQTWTHMGLSDSAQIANIIIDPIDPDTVYVAVQGNSYMDTEERGVYKSTDGGSTWRRVLYNNPTTGASDLKMDGDNRRVLFAAMWDHRRQPWEIRSGGEGSGIYRSVDSGETWEKLTEGLPEEVGKIGVAPSGANSDRVWAIVEAKEKGGLYRSDNNGKDWKLVNGDRRMFSRPWYYMHIFADPNDSNTVYVMNSGFFKSIDGGKSLSTIRAPHGDYHWLWINPDNSRNMADSNDGGANVTFDGGQSWSSMYTLPTAQIYRLTVDNAFPYRLYGGQQDNSSVGIRSRGLDGALGREDWDAYGGCESAFVAMDPHATNPRYYYSNCYLGQINEVDVVAGESRDVRAYAELAFGRDPSTRKYRFNWNSPVVVSAFDPSVIYHGSQMVLKSSDRGRTWTELSPDLTRDELDKQGPGGRPITNEVSENYNTLAYIKESPHSADVIWAGADDGMLHVTQDGGATWQDVTPRGVDDGLMNAIEVSPHDPATAYVAYTRYKYGDNTPVIYKTTNFGTRWQNIAEGIGDNDFVRVVREDPVRQGLLYAGTETGIYISFNDGDDWTRLQLNLPNVPVTDMHVKGDDLAISTQGRGFWILDNLTPLRHVNDDAVSADLHIYPPADGYNFTTIGTASNNQAQNPANGAWIYYSLGAEIDTKESPFKAEILNADGEVIRSYKAGERAAGGDGGGGGGGGGGFFGGAPARLETEAGLHKLVWNLRADNLKSVDGVFSIAGRGPSGIAGPGVAPGAYTVRMTLGETVIEQPFNVVLDPRATATADEIAAHQALLGDLVALMNELNGSFRNLISAEKQAKAVMAAAKGQDHEDGLKDAAKALDDAIKEWRESVASEKRTYFQDVLNWPDLLFSDVHSLYASVNGQIPPVTNGHTDRYADLVENWASAKASYDEIVADQLAAFNAAFRASGADVVTISTDDGDSEDREG